MYKYLSKRISKYHNKFQTKTKMNQSDGVLNRLDRLD